MIKRALLAVLLMATTAGEPVSEARSYLDTALGLLQQHSMESATADWKELRAEAHRDAAHARHAADVYPAIRRVITELGNPHTALLASATGGAPAPVRTAPDGRMIGSAAYLRLPETSSDNGDAYAEAGLRLVRDLAGAGPRGWVVDLRGNGGGDMHPMLTVVAPLLGEGRTGMFVHPDGRTSDWGVRDGHVHNGDHVVFPQMEMPVVGRGPVAVLVDGRTASSGEAVLLSFTGAAGTHSFGEPTTGFATGNEVFDLPDGARLAITTMHMADRTGRTYGNAPIAPQTQVSNSRGSADRVLDTAIAWLAGRT
ncbi:S41 family peptidase [Lentzea sp. BCCO 10_0798]|uniref:S41 family peptidase n=1 Tax=Lentzea kristufekii TaxID=3095430 RepID=A0ABU4U3A1_9PSEU|nr:S41 family peptidase [Lentzea sp. BCCO 10_0798]MDX8054582.1 S41 family peptidase [Lentzea sp. BCCO 10_0798]